MAGAFAVSAIAVTMMRVDGHGLLLSPPPPYLDKKLHKGPNMPIPLAGGSLWFNEGCQIGCSECHGFKDPLASLVSSLCPKERIEPTITDDSLITFPRLNKLYKLTGTKNYNPWLAPGSAPVYSPCGIAGGSGNYKGENGGAHPPGYEQGMDGRKLFEHDDSSKKTSTVWPAGSNQEVIWAINANHGGGYSYRLCPASSNLTEDCFQGHHLQFANNWTWIQRGDERTKIPAVRTRIGTSPVGSEWTRVPIPPCDSKYGGYDGRGCDAPAFESPIDGFWGFGPEFGCAKSGGAWMPSVPKSMELDEAPNSVCHEMMDYQIIDEVKVPDVLPGNYVMSFRWDCEQTSQVWTQCADIIVTGSKAMEVMV